VIIDTADNSGLKEKICKVFSEQRKDVVRVAACARKDSKISNALKTGRRRGL